MDKLLGMCVNYVFVKELSQQSALQRERGSSSCLVKHHFSSPLFSLSAYKSYCDTLRRAMFGLHTPGMT